MDEKLARILGLPTEAEKAAQQEQFDAKLKELFLSTQPDTSGAELLRSLVELDCFVAVKPDAPVDAPLSTQIFDIINCAPGRYGSAVAPPDDAKKSKSKNGKGGNVLPVYRYAPDRSARQVNGRSLVRMLPDTLGGLLLHLPEHAPRELGNEYFTVLLILADAIDLEEMLLRPAKDQIERLKNATWLVETVNGALHIDTSVDERRLINAYTHIDRVGWHQHKLEPMRGETLFQQLTENDDIDGVVINHRAVIELGNDSIFAPVLSPGFACRLLACEDIRPGAQPLPARNVREIELWLRLHRFPIEEVKLIDAPYPEVPLIRANAPGPSTWRMQETLHENRISKDECTWSPVFVLPPLANLETNAGTASEIAPGATRILCAGLLAKALEAHFHGAENPNWLWRPGRNLLIGRYNDEWVRKRSFQRLAIANELLKLLPPNVDTIPRDAVLTVEGAALIRQHPHAAKRNWIEATARQAERYTRRWVWWG